MSTSDEITKNFWAKQIPVLILKFAAQAAQASERNDKTDGAELRIEKYTNEYQEKVDLLMKK